MTEALAEWFTELRRPLNVPEFEPDIDDKDKEKDTQLRKGLTFLLHTAGPEPQLP